MNALIDHSKTQEESLCLSEALERGFIIIHPDAKVSASVRIIPCEDDGSSCGPIEIAAGARVREFCVICSGVRIGEHTLIGHMVVMRRSASIGANSLISHQVNIERDARVGSHVRISGLTHITGGCLIEDRVQIGARVATVNDNQLRWREHPELKAPIFRTGCRVGSGVTVLGGVEIGCNSLVGAGALVTKDVPPGCLAFGVPAYVQRELALG